MFLGSDSAAAVDGLTDDVSVAGVPSRLLDHVQGHPPQVLLRHLRPRARRIEVEAAEDLLRRGDLGPMWNST
jgi:hypothetical protein